MVGTKEENVSMTLFVTASILIVSGVVTSFYLSQKMLGVSIIITGLCSMLFSVMFKKAK